MYTAGMCIPIAERYGGEPLELSANISPFGIPERRQSRPCTGRSMDCARYPDPFCRAARRAIGAAEGVPDGICTAATARRMCSTAWRQCLRPRRALLTAPAFAEYERTLAGADIRFHYLREEEGFAVTERILSDITPETDAVYLCNPNNPTGRTVEPALLRAVAARCAQRRRAPDRGRVLCGLPAGRGAAHAERPAGGRIRPAAAAGVYQDCSRCRGCASAGA